MAASELVPKELQDIYEAREWRDITELRSIVAWYGIVP